MVIRIFNFQLQLSLFSAMISLKQSFLRDTFRNIILPCTTTVTEIDSEIMKHKNSELVLENERLNCEILELQGHNKAKDDTIKMLQKKRLMATGILPLLRPSTFIYCQTYLNLS